MKEKKKKKGTIFQEIFSAYLSFPLCLLRLRCSNAERCGYFFAASDVKNSPLSLSLSLGNRLNVTAVGWLGLLLPRVSFMAHVSVAGTMTCQYSIKAMLVLLDF